MKTDINDVLREAEDQLENSPVLIIGVIFVVLTSLFLAYHSFHIFKRLAGGDAAGKGAYVNALMAVGCVEASLIALIICHFLYFTTPAQKYIGIAGDVVTYAFLLFHTALNFRHNLFGYLDGFGHIYESNGLPVLVFGATLATWAGIILLDVRARMRIKTMSALSMQRERELKGVLRNKIAAAEPRLIEGLARGTKDERGEDAPKD